MEGGPGAERGLRNIKGQGGEQYEGWSEGMKGEEREELDEHHHSTLLGWKEVFPVAGELIP